MQRPYRTLENGIQELISDEEYIEFLGFHYAEDIKNKSNETFAWFYTKHVHDILRFHDSEQPSEAFLKLGAEDFSLHYEAYKRAVSSLKDPIKFN